jgi:hypothetical protein
MRSTLLGVSHWGTIGDMTKDKWLRVRLNDEQNEKLDRYTSVRGISRSDIIREIIDSMPTEATTQKTEINFSGNERVQNHTEITDSLGNHFLLSTDYRPCFNLWRIVLQRLGRFNLINPVAGVDLVKESKSEDDEIWLNSITPYRADDFSEADEFVWDAVKHLASQQSWSKIYGGLTLEQIEREPKQLSWLKKRGFVIESKPNKEDFYFSLSID